MFGRFFAYSLFLNAFLIPTTASAEVEHCANFPSDPTCRTGQPGSELPRSTVTITPERTNRPLNPRGLYRVEFVCRSKGQIPVDTKGLFDRLNVAAGLLIAISDQNTGGAPTPATSKAMLSVYNVGGPSTNRNSYINQACSNRPFFIAPRQPLYLIGAASYIETHEVGPFLKAIESVVSIVSSIWPLFTGLPVPTATNTQLSAIKNTTTPVGNFLSVFNNGLTDLKAPPLTEGHTVINAQFAKVDVHVTALRSIVGVSEQFKIDLESMLDTMIKPAITGTSDNTVIASACRSNEETLKTKANLSREDIAYSMVFVARNAGLLNASQFIHCLGRDYALIAAKSFVADLSEERRFDENAVKTVLPIILTTPQPEFRSVKFRMNRLMGELRTYVMDPAPPSFEQTMLGKNDMASSVQVDDAVDISRVGAGEIQSSDLMADFKSKGFVRFGCLMPDNDSLTFFLIFPETAAQPDKGYKFGEARLVRGWVNSDTKLSRVEITADNNQIATVVKHNGGGCGTASFADR